MKQDKLECVIAICVRGSICALTSQSIFKTLLELGKNKVDIKVHSNDSLIARSRNIAATLFLEKTNAPVLFFIDDDIIFFPEEFKSVLYHCLSGNYDIIGGFYSTKPGINLASIPMKDSKCYVPSNMKPIPAKYVSTGFCAIHRRVFETLAKKLPQAHKNDQKVSPGCNSPIPFYPFFEPFFHDGQWLSEDWALGQVARDAGFQSWLDPNTNLGHQGLYVYYLQDNWRAKRPNGVVPINITSEDIANDAILKAQHDIAEQSEGSLRLLQDGEHLDGYE